MGIETAREIRAQHAAGWSKSLLAEKYGVGLDAIRLILNGKSWREEVTE
jgi:hypothetical protein